MLSYALKRILLMVPTFFLIALMFVVINLLVDLSYVLIDPRVRLTGRPA